MGKAPFTRHQRRRISEAIPRRRLARMKSTFLLLLKSLNPVRWALAFRRSLTAASVSLLIAGIGSLNIVWGYPWMGMFAACTSLFVVGRLINHFALPSLQVSVDAPRWIAAGTSLPMSVRLINQGRWPGMNLWVETIGKCDWLPPEAEFAMIKELRLARRGIHPLPAILVESYFPFYLFRAHREIDPRIHIAVTPAPISDEDDELWRSLRTTLKGIATRISQGDQVHYIGSLEYREGIPVRRWDFSSWARLGKPILREFSTPAARSVRLWIDNVCADVARPRPRIGGRLAAWARPVEHAHEPFERILSLAAASIQTLARTGAAVTLSVTSNDSSSALRCEAGGDPSELLIALAALERIDPSSQSAEQLARWMRELQAGQDEALFVFSCRSRDALDREVPESTRWVTDRDFQLSRAALARETDSVPAAEIEAAAP